MFSSTVSAQLVRTVHDVPYLAQTLGMTITATNGLLNGLEAYWKFEEASGVNRLSSTNTHTLINFGTVIREDNHAEGSFSAGMMADNYFTNYDAIFKLTNNWSMNTWFMFTNTPGEQDFIIARWGPAATWLTSIHAAVGSNVVKFANTDSGLILNYVLNSTIAITASNWYNMSWGVDNTVIWLQVNDEPRLTVAHLNSLGESTDPLAFCFSAWNALGNVTGTFIDATGFWSRSLDTNDVANLWNNGNGLFYEKFTH